MSDLRLMMCTDTVSASFSECLRLLTLLCLMYSLLVHYERMLQPSLRTCFLEPGWCTIASSQATQRLQLWWLMRRALLCRFVSRSTHSPVALPKTNWADSLEAMFTIHVRALEKLHPPSLRNLLKAAITPSSSGSSSGLRFLGASARFSGIEGFEGAISTASRAARASSSSSSSTWNGPANPLGGLGPRSFTTLRSLTLMGL